jgi:VCBS repeat-containing protein
MVLERRIVLDAAALTTFADTSTPTDTASLDALLSQISAGDEPSLAHQQSWMDSLTAPATQDARSPLQIIFVDPVVKDYRQFVDHAPADAMVVLLDASRDGITQITETLGRYSNVEGVHIVTHGSDAMLRFSSSVLSANSLQAQAVQLQQWSASLAEGADILIYGCDVAASETGQAFLAQLSALIGADVAASIDATGAEALGGNWVLEFATGGIEAGLAYAGSLQGSYEFVLASFSWTGSGDGLSWEDPDNWNLFSLPGEIDDVTINGDFSVNLDSTHIIANLLVTGGAQLQLGSAADLSVTDVVVTGGSGIDIAGGYLFAGTMTVDTGSVLDISLDGTIEIDPDGALVINGSGNWSDYRIDAVNVALNGELVLGGAGYFGGGLIVNSGSLLFETDSVTQLSSSLLINEGSVQLSGILTGTPGDGVFGPSYGDVDNRGFMQWSDGGITSLVLLVNSGTLDIDGAVDMAADFYNEAPGLVVLSGADSRLSLYGNTVENSGEFRFAADGDVIGASSLSAFANYGRLTKTGGAADGSDESLLAHGAGQMFFRAYAGSSVELSAGRMVLSWGTSDAGIVLDNGAVLEFGRAGTGSFSTSVELAAATSIAGTGSIEVLDEFAELRLGVSLDLVDSLDVVIGDGATLYIGGTLELNGQLSSRGTIDAVEGQLIVNGTFDWIQGAFTGDGILEVGSSALVTIGNDELDATPAVLDNWQLRNNGVIELTGVAPLALRNGAGILNYESGDIRVQSSAGIDVQTDDASTSRIENQGYANWSDGGEFRIAADTTLELAGFNAFSGPAQIAGAGSVVFINTPYFDSLSFSINLSEADQYTFRFTTDAAGPLQLNGFSIDNGTLLDNDDGTLTYIPNDSFVGIDSFSYSVLDSTGNPDQVAIIYGSADVRYILSWDGEGGDSDWFNALNWSSDMLPGAEDGVVLGDGDIVILGAGFDAVTVHAVTILTGGSLLVEGELQIGDRVAIEAGGELIVGGLLATYGVDVAAGGRFDIAGGSVIGSGGYINIEGDASWGGDYLVEVEYIPIFGSLTLGGSGVLQSSFMYIDEAGLLRLVDGSLSLEVSTLYNAGTMELSNATLDAPDGSYIANLDSGVMRSNGSVAIHGSFDNEGLLRVDSGVLQFVDGYGYHTGQFDVAADSLLRFVGTQFLDSGTVLTGSGTVEFAGNVDIYGALTTPDTLSLVQSAGALTLWNPLTVNGEFRLEGGAVLWSINGGSGGSLLLHGSATWTAGNLYVDTTVAVGATLTISGSGAKQLDYTLHNEGLVELQGNVTGFVGSDSMPGALFNDGEVVWTQGSLDNVIFTNNGELEIAGDVTLAWRVLHNYGLVRVSDDAAVLRLANNAGVSNEEDGEFRFEADGDVFGISGSTGFTNYGLLSKTGGSPGGESLIVATSPATLQVANYAGIEVSAGKLALGSGFAYGSMTLANGAALEFGRGGAEFWWNNTIALAGEGVLQVLDAGAELWLGVGYDADVVPVGMTLEVGTGATLMLYSSGTLQVDGTLVNRGTIYSEDDNYLIVNGLFDWVEGELGGYNGTLQVNSGGEVRIGGSDELGAPAVLDDWTIENAGLVRLTGAPLVLYDGGSIYNLASGEIRAETAAGIDVDSAYFGYSVISNLGLVNWTDAGQVRITSAAMLELQGTQLFANTAQIEGAGSLVFGGTVQFEDVALGVAANSPTGVTLRFDSGPLIFRAVAASAGSFVLDAGAGDLTYTPAVGFVGTDVFYYEVYDSFGDNFVRVDGTVQVDIDAITWDGGGDELNWSDPLNWSNDALPQAWEYVLLDGDITVQLGDAQSVYSLAVTNGARLLLAGALTTTNASVESGGRIDLSGTIDLTSMDVADGGFFYIADGTVLGASGALTMGGFGQWAGQYTLDLAAVTIADTGHVVITGVDGSVGTIDVPAFVNQGTIDFFGSASGAQELFLTGTFSNAGYLEFQESVHVYDAGGQILNTVDGYLRSAGDAVVIDVDLDNAGIVDVTAGTLYLGGNGTHTGSFDVSGAAGTLQFGITGSSNAQLLDSGVALAGSGTVRFSGQNDIHPALTTPASLTLVQDAGSLTLWNPLTIAGGFVLAGGSVDFSINGGSGGSLWLDGTASWSGGDLHVNTTVGSAGQLVIGSDADSVMDRTLHNLGRVTLSGALRGTTSISTGFSDGDILNEGVFRWTGGSLTNIDFVNGNADTPLAGGVRLDIVRDVIFATTSTAKDAITNHARIVLGTDGSVLRLANAELWNYGSLRFAADGDVIGVSGSNFLFNFANVFKDVGADSGESLIVGSSTGTLEYGGYGTLGVSAGKLALGAGFSFETIALANTAVLELGRGGTGFAWYVGTVLTGDGVVQLADADAFLAVAVGDGLELPEAIDLRIEAGATLILQNALTIGGTLTNRGDVFADVDGGPSVLLAINGRLQWEQGQLYGNGFLYVAPTAEASLGSAEPGDDAAFLTDWTLYNDGLLHLAGMQGLALTDATLINADGAEIRVDSGAVLAVLGKAYFGDNGIYYAGTSVIENWGAANWVDAADIQILGGELVQLELAGRSTFARSDQFAGDGSIIFRVDSGSGSVAPGFLALELAADYSGVSFRFDGGPVNLDVEGLDATGGSLGYDLVAGTITFTPDAGFVGTALFSYKIYDSSFDETATVYGSVEVTNTDPVAADDSTETDEDTPVVIDVLANDTDADRHVLSVFEVTQGSFGSVVINADGTLTYTPHADYNGSDSFTYTVSDDFGGTSTATVNVTVFAINDDPVVVSGDASGAVTEDADDPTLETTGSILFDDVDAADVHSVSVSAAESNELGGTLEAEISAPATGAGTVGSITWTYRVANSVTQSLAAGQTVTEHFVIWIDDDNGGSVPQAITITIAGTNDVPVIGGISTRTLVEDASTPELFAQGRLLITDADAGESAFVAQSGTAGSNGYGTFTLNAVGRWTFTAANDNPAIQALAAGETLSDSFVATSVDRSASQVVTVTIIGVNDAAVIGGVTTGEVTEDASTPDLVTGGALTIVDADAGESAFVVQAATAGAYGTFTLDAAGNWSYTAANDQVAIQALAAGETLSDSFVATSVDGSASQLVTVTITGVNDVPVIGGVTARNLTEDASTPDLVARGALTIVDADAGESAFVAQAATAGAYGTFTVDAAGNWTYTAANDNPAIQALAEGARLIERFTVTSVDGSASQVVTVRIIGVNDVPAIGGVTTGEVTEDASTPRLVTDGALTIVDADAGESAFVAQSGTAGSNGYGIFTLDASGNWSYTALNEQAAIQALAAGETLSDSFTATSVDGSASQLVTVTITGVNDVPVISGVSTRTLVEDASTPDLLAQGRLLITDADAGESAFVVQAATTGSSGYGVFTLNAAGRWTYTAANDNPAIQALAAGETLSDSFVATSVDGSASQLVTVTIVGVNDAAVIGGITTGEVTEDASTPDLVTGGALTITDADAGESAFVVQAATAGAYGTFTLDAAGNWSYTAANDQAAIQSLAASETLSDSFVATSVDGSASQLVTVTITGVNDAAVIGGVTARNLTEDASTPDLVANGALTIADADAGESAFVAQAATAGVYGTFTVDAAGNWSYTALNEQAAIQALAAGDRLVERFTVTSADGSASQVVTVRIIGVNDVPAIGGVTTGAVTTRRPTTTRRSRRWRKARG